MAVAGLPALQTELDLLLDSVREPKPASSRLGVDAVLIRSLSHLAGDSAAQCFDRLLPEVSANSGCLVSALLHRLEEDQRDLSVRA